MECVYLLETKFFDWHFEPVRAMWNEATYWDMQLYVERKIWMHVSLVPQEASRLEPRSHSSVI